MPCLLCACGQHNVGARQQPKSQLVSFGEIMGPQRHQPVRAPPVSLSWELVWEGCRRDPKCEPMLSKLPLCTSEAEVVRGTPKPIDLRIDSVN